MAAIESIKTENNRIPENVTSVHLIGICGTAMGALALMLKDLGFRISGSDTKAYPPISTFLQQGGIAVAEGFSADHLQARPDLVVVGNAIRRDNPEAVETMRLGLHYCSMPQAINRFAAAGKESIVVTGTHGKTTTSCLMAWVLHCAGLDPSFVIGGIHRNFQSNYRLGTGPFIVLEGDEYDTAFFDKGPKFLHYDPHVAILTSVEFDHADIFADLDHVKSAFGRFLANMTENQTLVACGDDPIVRELAFGRKCRKVFYGKSAGNTWRIGDAAVAPPWASFDVICDERPFRTFRTHMTGEHNRLNALSVAAAAESLGIPPDTVAHALETFEGVKRRQEIRGVKRGIVVMDDFAHHPTAVRETIRGVRPFYPDGRLIAVFEPRTNSSMRKIFQNDYPLAFDEADLILIREPPMLQKIPEGERFSSRMLVEDLRRRGKDAHYFSDTDAIIAWVVKEARAKDLVLIMSNGGFDDIHERLLKEL